ncbi:hypothetical protein [Streptomyces sp. NPDC088739]|uniref:hypothetical protein n=1 Tax=Streptomyces sp. NPDC088739 TaxID=3365882 RepID=UPI00382F869D
MTDRAEQLAPSTLTLTDLLLAGADDRRVRAALGLLIWHETWITRLAALTGGPGSPVVSDEDMARVNWKAWTAKVENDPYPYSTGELYVLDVAASIAAGTVVSLHGALGDGNGTATRRAIVQAITEAAGDLDEQPWNPDTM